MVCTNVKLKTIRLLEERIRESNHDFELGKEILDRPQKAQSMKEKERLVRLLNYTIKLQFKHQMKKVNCVLNFLIKNFFSLREPMRKSKNKLPTRRKYLENMYLIVTVSYANLTRLPSRGFPGSTVVKNPPANAGDARNEGSIPGSGISPAVGNGNPLQYS